VNNNTYEDSAFWYVAQTRPQQERVAEDNLRHQGYACYLPRITLQKRRRGHWQAVTEALFPGYLFVQLDLGSDNIAPLRSTRGMRGLVRFGQQHLPVPTAVIAYLQAREEKQQDPIHGNKPPLPFRPGDELTILEGPFTGLRAIYERPKGEDRVMVLIDILNSTQRVAVDPDVLGALESVDGTLSAGT
jgi:transcriptional antiterminator RfaH